MSSLSRRRFLGVAAAGTAAFLGSAGPSSAGAKEGPGPKVALIHTTDLYRPHIDPDDHFDLATAFALAAGGRFELLAVMIDHPPAGAAVDPDVQAVAQLSRISGLAVPVLTGTRRRLSPEEASLPEHREDAAGVRALLEVLRASTRPVFISIVGSTRDVALAGRLEPKLFAAKCAGILLNAGSGTPDKIKAARLEYNVNLDPVSYAAIFDLPCRLYWLPCFEVAPGGGVPFASGEYGTYYRFLQRDLFSRLSPAYRTISRSCSSRATRTGLINPRPTPFVRAGCGRSRRRPTGPSSNARAPFTGTCGRPPGSFRPPA